MTTRTWEIKSCHEVAFIPCDCRASLPIGKSTSGWAPRGLSIVKLATDKNQFKIAPLISFGGAFLLGAWKYWPTLEVGANCSLEQYHERAKLRVTWWYRDSDVSRAEELYDDCSIAIATALQVSIPVIKYRIILLMAVHRRACYL